MEFFKSFSKKKTSIQICHPGSLVFFRFWIFRVFGKEFEFKGKKGKLSYDHSILELLPTLVGTDYGIYFSEVGFLVNSAEIQFRFKSIIGLLRKILSRRFHEQKTIFLIFFS